MNLWLGSIPAHWHRYPAWSVFAERTERAAPDDEHLTPSQTHGVIAQTTYMEITGNRVVLNLTGADNMKAVRAGDFVIHLRSFQGGIEASSVNGKVSQAYTVLNPRLNVAGCYFRHLFKSRLFIEQLVNLTDQLRDGQSINYARFSRLSLPIPPLDDQRRIADYLDRETAEIDWMDGELDRLIETLRERRTVAAKSAFASAFEGADLVPLWSILRAVKDQDHPHEQVLSVYRDYGVIPKDSRDDNNNRTPENVSGYQLVLPGDVVINKMKAWQGSLGVSTYRGIISPDYQVCRPVGVGVDTRYLHLVLRSPWLVPQYAVRSKGIRPSQWRLYWDDMAPMRVPLPPLDEQRRIVAELDEQAVRIDDMVADARRLKGLLAERRSTLITDVVTGKKEVPA